ncbi:MATE family efflux transporter [Sporomusa sp. GT1]|uniref:MATE family efflux transporter n=1 Tax=Sporomusa sp. GT1 TaxID=1534747 RepID=UPI0016681D00|nr:MATE family efflux transporter [Sporomusa sp. GT1]
MDKVYSEESNTSFRQIIKITYPVVLSMLSFNVLVFVDRLYVSWYDLTQFAAMLPASFTAIGLASIFTGIVGYVSTLSAQYYGAGRYPQCAASMWQGIYLSIVFALLPLSISPIVASVFQLMGHTGSLLAYEREYFYLIIIAECIQMFSTAFFGFYCGIGDTKTTMQVAVLMNIINVILAGGLVFGKFGLPELGMMGSGLAAIISCLVGLFCYVLFLHKAVMRQYQPWQHYRPNKPLLCSLLRFGLFAGIQSFAEMGYFSIFLLIIGSMGAMNLAAVNAAFAMEAVFILPVIGMTTAVGILAGQEKGAGRLGNIPEIFKKGLVLGLSFNVLILISCNFFPEQLISIFHSDTNADQHHLVSIATPLLQLTSLWLVFDTIHLMVGSVLKSTGDTRFMMLVYTVVPLFFYVIMPYVFCVWYPLPLSWLWLLLVVYSATMLLLMATRFVNGKWKSIKVIEQT